MSCARRAHGVMGATSASWIFFWFTVCSGSKPKVFLARADKAELADGRVHGHVAAAVLDVFDEGTVCSTIYHLGPVRGPIMQRTRPDGG